ncbi:MAG: hypothetical protein CVV42_18265 [Candidatus Riflebacteria bacterium HGW-Riflebacteria-2]|jgi:hypothetical protein|nr:MAG: hypothetical protein CVV42_18265 [Candidatus Riflebacteria bacterium HGW-Riflebacteria-2]
MRYSTIVGYARIVISSLFVFSFLVFVCSSIGCGCGGFEYSSGVQGEIEVKTLPGPEAPSKVLGIGPAMSEGKDILIFRQTRKASSLPLNERNFFFISKVMQSYQPAVKVIEIPNSVSYPQGDYYSVIMDHFPGNGYGVLKNEDGGFKLYTSTFGYSEKYDEMVVPVIESIEKVLGPCPFDKRKLILNKSKYPEYTKAMKEGKSIIFYCFANCCNSFPPSQQASLERQLKTNFANEAGLVKIDHKAYTDPANELYSQCENIVSVYNSKTRKISPALFSGSDTIANVRKFLNER